MWHLQQAAENQQHDESNDGEETEAGSPEIADVRLAHESPHELSFEFSPELKKVAEQFPDESNDAEAVAQSRLRT